MKRDRLRIRVAAAALIAAAVAAAIVAATTAAAGSSYRVHNLVSDVPGQADHLDPNLVNAWGLAALPASPWWVADNEANVSTIYLPDGTPRPLVVEVANAPTGLVANDSQTGFVVSSGSASGPSLFLFATEEGKILGWSPSVSLTQAQVAVDMSGAAAIFKGLALAATRDGSLLYATDFHNGRVDVFDSSFAPVHTPGAFVDPRLPAGYGPFGIQAIDGRVFVTYAKQDADAEDDVQGQGLGFVDVYDTNGALLGRVATHGQLNAPWGLALAPAGFGRFGGDLLVGNFGDGQITAFAPKRGAKFTPAGQLRGIDGKPIAIDGLWALQFGRGNDNNGPPDTLFFTAGPNDETHGLFGAIRAG